MTKRFNVLSFLASILIMSCNNESNLIVTDMIQQESIEKQPTFSVSLSDIQKLETAQMKGTRAASFTTDSIKFIIDDSNDTLFYIVNHAGGGWTMYASDMRVPAVVAESDKGTYEEAVSNESVNSWIYSMADDMKQVKRSESTELSIPLQQQKTNENFWRSIYEVNNYLSIDNKNNNLRKKTKVLDMDGHWELFSVSRNEEVFDSVPHLTQTRWDQYEPFNECCPSKTTGEGRCPAGCVAIAGAQMLYFLHYSIGVPQNAPSTGYCYGNKNSYSWHVGNENSTVWDDMPLDNRNSVNYSAAPLIGLVGQLVGMNYDNNESGADTGSLKSDVFEYYGISCTMGNYNANTVIASLKEGMPVVARARTKNDGGHSFIIDGYKECRTKTTTVYEWVYDVNPTTITPYIPPQTVVTTSSPYVKYIRMNWGWGRNNSNDTWFAVTDDWIVRVDNTNLSLTRGKLMIYNFNEM